MRRRLVIAAVVLLAGAVVNVAVTWFFPFELFPRVMERGPATDEDVAWLLRHMKATADDDWRAAETTLVRRVGARARLVTVHNAWAPLAVYAARLETGWPLFSFRSRQFKIIVQAPGWPATEHRVNYAELPWLSWDGRPIGVPTGIVWPGFAVNTLFYAALLWLVICGPFALRRFLRIRRGLCPYCAYPMGEGAMCTECGRALPEQRERTG